MALTFSKLESASVSIEIRSVPNILFEITHFDTEFAIGIVR